MVKIGEVKAGKWTEVASKTAAAKTVKAKWPGAKTVWDGKDRFEVRQDGATVAVGWVG